MKTNLSLFFILMLFYTACKKKEVIEDKPAQNQGGISLEMQKISAYPWLIYKVTLAGFDAFDQLDDCQKDDTYKFNRDSSLVQYKNTLECSGGMDSVVTQWHFLDNRTKIYGTVLGLTDTASIITLQDNDMRLLVDYFGTPATIYFKKP